MAIEIKSVKNNIVKVCFPDITDSPSTYLTAAVAATGTTLTVKDNNGLADDDYLVIGDVGVDKTEIKKVNAAVTYGTSLTTTALTFDHPAGTKITLVRGNQIVIKRATTEAGSYSTVSTLDLNPNALLTEYDDSAAGSSTSWYKVSLYDEDATTTVETSQAVQNGGYATTTAGYVITNVAKRLRVDNIDWTLWIGYLNTVLDDLDFYRKKWGFQKTSTNDGGGTKGVDLISLPSDIKEKNQEYIISVNYNNSTKNLEYVDLEKMRERVNAVCRTELADDVALIDTTIDLVDASAFPDSGTITISGDNIDYTAKSGNTLTGVTSISATHSEGDIVFLEEELDEPMTYTLYGDYIWVYPATDTSGEYTYIDYYSKFSACTSEDSEINYPDTSLVELGLRVEALEDSFQFEAADRLRQRYEFKKKEQAKRHWSGEKVNRVW